jgi:hypothetical protein
LLASEPRICDSNALESTFIVGVGWLTSSSNSSTSDVKNWSTVLQTNGGNLGATMHNLVPLPRKSGSILYLSR